MTRPLQKRQTISRRLPRETFGVLRDRGFSLNVYCDPCKDATFVNLAARPDLAAYEIGEVDFECRQCGGICHYKLEPPYRAEKRLLHEQAVGCRGPADHTGTPVMGPFPMLTELGNSIGDFAAQGVLLLVCCPGGRERLIDPRLKEWHRIHHIDFFKLRMHCEGCRQRASILLAPSWYKFRGFKVVRASKIPQLPPPRPAPTEGAAFSSLQNLDELWLRLKAEHEAKAANR